MARMTNLKASAYLALMYGFGLTAFETFVNWGQWQWWPFWLVDYVAAAVLFIGGIATLKAHSSAAKLLCLGWGFTLGMMWMSMAGNIADGTDPARAARVANLYIVLIGFSLFISLVGLLLALRGTQSPDGP